MLKRLLGLIGFCFFWTVSALIFPILFWVLSAAILTATIIHMVRVKEFHSPGRLFTGVGLFTALVATVGFFAGGDDVTAESSRPVARAEQSAEVDEVLATIKAASATARKKSECSSLDAVAAAWKELVEVPSDDRSFGRAKKAAAQLEWCRKKAATALQKGAIRSRAQERAKLAKTIQTELNAIGVKLKPKTQGRSKEKLLLKGRKLTGAKVDKAFAGGSTDDNELLGRLQAAGFVKVTVSAGKLTREYALAPTKDTALVDAQLINLGLAEPLKFQ